MSNKITISDVKLIFNQKNGNNFEINFPNKKQITASDLLDVYLKLESFLIKHPNIIVNKNNEIMGVK